MGFAHQQSLEVQHVFLSQDDESSRAAERVAAVRLQTRHAAETTLPVLTPGDKHGTETIGGDESGSRGEDCDV